jgi:hypothetical protein
MGRTTLEEKVVTFIRNAVDMTVDNTGYPVLAKYLEEASIATRKQLRQLEKKGHLKAITVRHNIGTKGGTQYKAYYTERLVPEWVTKQEELRKQAEEKLQAVTSEA